MPRITLEWLSRGYLGHKNIRHTATYKALSSDRFRDFWRD